MDIFLRTKTDMTSITVTQLFLPVTSQIATIAKKNKSEDDEISLPSKLAEFTEFRESEDPTFGDGRGGFFDLTRPISNPCRSS